MSGGRLVLAIETSTRRGSVAARALDGGATRVVQLDEARGHGSDLMPTIAELVPSAAALEMVVVGRGPGSYTGMRVGCATALGLAMGSGARLVGVGSLAAAALAGLAPGERGVVLRDAFGGKLYLAAFARSGDGALRAEGEPACAAATDALERARRAPVVLGDARALERCGELDGVELRASGGGAGELLELALAGGDGGLVAEGEGAAQPLYLRPFEGQNRRR